MRVVLRWVLRISCMPSPLSSRLCHRWSSHTTLNYTKSSLIIVKEAKQQQQEQKEQEEHRQYRTVNRRCRWMLQGQCSMVQRIVLSVTAITFPMDNTHFEFYHLICKICFVNFNNLYHYILASFISNRREVLWGHSSIPMMPKSWVIMSSNLSALWTTFVIQFWLMLSGNDKYAHKISSSQVFTGVLIVTCKIYKQF